MSRTGTPLNYNGKLFKLSRGFKLRFEPLRKHIPIWTASLNSKSVEFTARHTDGWLPSMIPLSGLARRSTSYVRLRRRQAAGRMKSRSNLPGHVTITNNPERAQQPCWDGRLLCSRMGTFYSEQLARFGFGEDVAKVKEAWDAGGSKAGTKAVSEKLVSELGYVGGIEGAIERLNAQDEAGIDVHQIEIEASSPAEFEKIVTRLL